MANAKFSKLKGSRLNTLSERVAVLSVVGLLTLLGGNRCSDDSSTVTSVETWERQLVEMSFLIEHSLSPSPDGRCIAYVDLKGDSS